MQREKNARIAQRTSLPGPNLCGGLIGRRGTAAGNNARLYAGSDRHAMDKDPSIPIMKAPTPKFALETNSVRQCANHGKEAPDPP